MSVCGSARTAIIPRSPSTTCRPRSSKKPRIGLSRHWCRKISRAPPRKASRTSAWGHRQNFHDLFRLPAPQHWLSARQSVEVAPSNRSACILFRTIPHVIPWGISLRRTVARHGAISATFLGRSSLIFQLGAFLSAVRLSDQRFVSLTKSGYTVEDSFA